MIWQILVPCESPWLAFLSRHYWLACRPATFCQITIITMRGVLHDVDDNDHGIEEDDDVDDDDEEEDIGDNDEEDDDDVDEDKVPRGVAGVTLASGVRGTASCSRYRRGSSL